MDNHKKIIHLIIANSVLFLILIGYLTHFQVFRAADIANNTFNRRLWEREENTIRGTIFDGNGVVLAETIEEDHGLVRRYLFNNIYSHLIGYSHRQYGRAGLEAQLNNELMGFTNDGTVMRIRDRIVGDVFRGNHIYLTINHQLQQLGSRLLAGKTGAIVAVNPRTGEILAMVSKPDFNPNTLNQDWHQLINNENSPLLNRATQGLYPPGSTFKVVITAAILEGGIDASYVCDGSIVIDGFTLSNHNQRAHGQLDLKRSLAVSCNTNYARMSQELGEKRIKDIAKRFRLGESLRGDINIAQSRIPYNKMSPTDLAAVSIGQGRLQVTPIHMAMIAATIANDGIMMEPRIVREVVSPAGRTLRTMEERGMTVIYSEIANEIKEMMEAAVTEGTGRNAAISGVRVGGKTGTAENPHGKAHAWFIGFAPVENPQIAVAVILENDGRTGGAAAAPIVRELIIEALKRGALN